MESTYADTSLLKNFTPVLNFEFYDLPEGPGIMFDLRCGGMGKKGWACIPVSGGCKCVPGNDTGSLGGADESVHVCTLMTEKLTGRKFCEGTCDSTQTCFPLMMYESKIRASRGVAGCICLPLKGTP